MENIQKQIIELTKRVKQLEEQMASFLQKPKKQEEMVVNKKERDKTKYMFAGSIYSKNQLVLAVVTAYVKQHPKTNFFELSKVFDKSLQGSLGVVELYEVAGKKTDAKKRYYMNNLVELPKETVVVCTQWGAFNIYKFILRAKELGFNIREILN